MLSLRRPFPLLVAGLLASGLVRGAPAPAATVHAVASSSTAVASVRFGERLWGVGSLPSLTFTVSAGRGPIDKVAAFLYTSESPEAFLTASFPPQFVGILTTPSSVDVIVQRPPERGPAITPSSRERFVQGALFDAQSGALLSVTNEDYLDIAYDAPPTTYTLDFETDDDFTTPFVNGQDLSTPPEFGNLVSIDSRQPVLAGVQHQGPAIFNTRDDGPNKHSSDPDLLVNLGNAVILQENPGQTVPGIFDLPDDSANGGTLLFDFSGFAFIEKVAPISIDLIDVDSLGGVEVVLIDVLGRQRTIHVPANWTGDINVNGPPGYRTLNLATLLPQPGFGSTATTTGNSDFLPGEVVRMEVVLSGSGAIDNLVFQKEADPIVAGRGKRATPASGGLGNAHPRKP